VSCVELLDRRGTHIGNCSGTLLSSSTVLTAGHCVVAASKWVITTTDGKQKANGARVFTTWKDFESNWSHPQHSDIGVILLDRDVFVSKYPRLADTLASDGARLSRVRRVDPNAMPAKARFDEVSGPIVRGQDVGFSLAYTMDAALLEGATDTGGGVYDPGTNILYGVVSSRGVTTSAPAPRWLEQLQQLGQRQQLEQRQQQLQQRLEQRDEQRLGRRRRRRERHPARSRRARLRQRSLRRLRRQPRVPRQPARLRKLRLHAEPAADERGRPESVTAQTR
jgi:hypothetical protein